MTNMMVKQDRNLKDAVGIGLADEPSNLPKFRSPLHSLKQDLIDHDALMEVVRANWKASQLSMTQRSAQNKPDLSKSCTKASRRLRDLASHVEHGSVPQGVLYQTLEYAASVLESISMDQIRVSDDEDGDLSEVQPDVVPNEVRKWLETTFTRNSISQKRRSEDKFKFRSVAQAIRAGIVVDRIYRRMSASTPFVSNEISDLLKSIDEWSFDCFQVNQLSKGQVLKSVAFDLFTRYGLIYKFKIPMTTLKNFLSQIENGYLKHRNPYHNNLHAADVTQTVHFMIWQGGLANWLSDLEIFATLLAAIIHDYLHTGTTNNFHVMSQSDTALIYNDRAVLENFHICQAFSLMRNDDCNILSGLSKDEYREFRSLVIDMVLATDMSSHFQQIKAMKNLLNHSDNFNADKSKILSLVIHISDISHPAKDWELHSRWTKRLMEEFFRQGDREKELDLECSPLCDRETTLVAESQLGFIEFIVSPSLEVCGDVLDRLRLQMAEANARPIIPASKAASLVASSAGSSQGTKSAPNANIEPIAKAMEPAASRPTSCRQPPRRSESDGKQPVGSAGSSTATSESLASNLRKIIVSSSATIRGRILGSSSTGFISGSLGGSAIGCQASPSPPLPVAASRQPAGSASQQQQQQQANLAASGANAPCRDSDRERERAAADFEARQANYRHPVIQFNQAAKADASHGSTAAAAASSSSSSCSAPQAATTSASSSARSEQQSGPKSTDLRGSQSQQPAALLATVSSNHPSNTPRPLRMSRPWIKCLEKNKRMWNDRAIQDERIRELNRKSKLDADDESNPTAVEDHPPPPPPRMDTPSDGTESGIF